jgi:HSP20 family molecular chaperone IbpA
MTFVKYKSFPHSQGFPFRIFSDSPEAAVFNKQLYPKVDIVEKENEVIINAELPGMRKDEIKLVVEKGLLTLSGEVKGESKEASCCLKMLTRIQPRQNMKTEFCQFTFLRRNSRKKKLLK